MVAIPNSIEELNKWLYQLVQQQRLSAADVDLLAQLLYNKWYPVQILTAKVLAKFNPPQAAGLLKDWLLHHAADRNMRFEVQKALVPCLSSSDLEWIVKLYLERRDAYRSFMISALIRFPRPDIIEQIVLDCRQAQNSTSIVVLAGLPLPDRAQMRQRLLDDPHIPNKSLIERAFSWEVVATDKLLGFKKPL